jgi:hypothetical protein
MALRVLSCLLLALVCLLHFNQVSAVKLSRQSEHSEYAESDSSLMANCGALWRSLREIPPSFRCFLSPGDLPGRRQQGQKKSGNIAQQKIKKTIVESTVLPRSDRVSFGALNDAGPQREILRASLRVAAAISRESELQPRSEWTAVQKTRFDSLEKIAKRFKALLSGEKGTGVGMAQTVPKWYHGVIGASFVNETIASLKVRNDPGAASVWASSGPLTGYGPLFFAFGTQFEGKGSDSLLDLYAEDAGMFYAARRGPLNLTAVNASDGSVTLQFSRWIAADNATFHLVRALFAESLAAFPPVVLDAVLSVGQTLEEAMLENAIITLGRVWSRDRANAAAEGACTILWSLTEPLNRSSIGRYGLFGADACAPRHCLPNANTSVSLATLWGGKDAVCPSDGRAALISWAGDQFFDEPRALAGATPKFVLVQRDRDSGKCNVTDMQLERLSSSYPADGRRDPAGIPMRVPLTRTIDTSKSSRGYSAHAVSALAMMGWPSWKFVQDHSDTAEADDCGRFSSPKTCLPTPFTEILGSTPGTTGEFSDPTQIAVNGDFETNGNKHPAVLYCSLAYKNGMCNR